MTPTFHKHISKLKLDTRKKTTPSQQIANQIKLLIRDKELVEGDVLPNIQNMAETLKVDKSVIESAYQSLVDAVYIKESDGIYKVVRLQMMEGFLKGFYSVFDTFQRHGFTPSSEEIDAYLVESLPKELEELTDQLEGPFIFQRRLYKVNDNPLFLVDFYNLPKYFEGQSLPLKDIDFLTYFKKELNHPMVHFHREVLALKPTPEEANYLGIPDQNAILGAKLINYDQDYVPLNFSVWRGSLKFSFWLKTHVK